MKIIILSSLLLFLVNRSECNFDFREVNIKNFELNSSEKDFDFGDKTKFKKTVISNEAYIIEFQEITQILTLEKNVFYVLRFENNILEGYTFKIPVEENKIGTKFYYDVLKRVNKTTNDFINSEVQLAYMKTTKNCKRFFRLTNSEIFGGIHKS
jgi:hypothetical protein